MQGQIWAPNPERGVYRTKDGGETWEQVLEVNFDTGATDVTMDPTKPRILYAGMWHHGRNPWFLKSGGEGNGIYKPVDGQLRYLLDTIDDSGAPVTEGMRLRHSDLTADWQELKTSMQGSIDSYIEPINRWAHERREPHVVNPM